MKNALKKFLFWLAIILAWIIVITAVIAVASVIISTAIIVFFIILGILLLAWITSLILKLMGKLG